MMPAMTMLLLAALHLLALGLGLGAVLGRAGALRDVPGPAALRRALRGDAVWGVAGGLWLATGLWRWLGAVEKANAYYLSNGLFHAKLGLFVLVLVLEVWPMLTLIRWRRALARGARAEDLMAEPAARRIAALSTVQAVLVAGIVFLAVAVARGYGTAR